MHHIRLRLSVRVLARASDSMSEGQASCEAPSESVKLGVESERNEPCAKPISGDQGSHSLQRLLLRRPLHLLNRPAYLHKILFETV